MTRWWSGMFDATHMDALAQTDSLCWSEYIPSQRCVHIYVWEQSINSFCFVLALRLSPVGWLIRGRVSLICITCKFRFKRKRSHVEMWCGMARTFGLDILVRPSARAYWLQNRLCAWVYDWESMQRDSFILTQFRRTQYALIYALLIVWLEHSVQSSHCHLLLNRKNNGGLRIYEFVAIIMCHEHLDPRGLRGPTAFIHGPAVHLSHHRNLC